MVKLSVLIIASGLICLMFCALADFFGKSKQAAGTMFSVLCLFLAASFGLAWCIGIGLVVLDIAVGFLV